MNTSTELEYVGFWLRAWAVLIDTIILLAVAIPLMMIVFGREQLAEGVTLTGPANFVVSYLLPALAILAFWIARQATPGKMLIGAKIVDAATGNPPRLWQHIVRYLGYFLSTLAFGLGFFWVAFDKRKQGWHDKLARTVVVRPAKRHAEPVRFG